MKKILILFLISISSYGQFKMFGRDPLINKENFDKQRVHWGYFLGFNSLDFKFDYLSVTEDIQVNSTIGFNVGLIGNLRLSDHFDFRFEPGLYITQRNLTYPTIEDPIERFREVKSTYIFFPALLKFSSKRTGNIKPYLIGGLSTALNLGSLAKSPEDNYNRKFRMTNWSSFYEIGFGIDVYFEYFKFSPSIRGVFSTKDELIRDNNPNSPWTGNVQSMKTRGIFINFAFH
ncbi:PorT family protein [Flavobacterium sp. NRK F10]|uniref:PorT protein n=1 Tax=Flavobacterium sediminis TaxID=2201181 RepID=A0A2U8QSU8_9FLAO|nr:MULTISPECIES: porin family protein [Flavobacterium]AWM13233.1 PorT protein [Flavobacterium sediminis]MCO6174407.1 PorT family protein [Flavobacterium sp. NRK F10]